jgi:dihydrofolate synthase/folylpolyglutamate synthase
MREPPEIMNYHQALDYIVSRLPMFHRIGAAAYKPDLGNIEALCKKSGNPQQDFRSVHIAGTNGKGSTSHMLASILMEAGFKTGLFTSPHLTDFRERIRVNGKMIPKTRVARFITSNRKEFEALRPSFFEMTTALAFEYFRDEKADIAVIETGLGGRLDSTNIITPLLSVITNISFDHAQFLGDTLEKIAREKAGIIKPGIPVVIGETQTGVMDVFLQKAKEMNAPVTFADGIFGLKSTVPGHLLKVIVEEKGSGSIVEIHSPLTGSYQAKNIITVLGAVRVMRSAGFPITDRHLASGIRKVIRNTGIRGRWQVLSREPLTICDTGHNEGGLREVVRQIRSTPHDKMHFVFGAVEDKDLTEILKMLPPEAIYYFCKADVPRGLDAGVLKQAARGAGLHGQDYPSVRAAYQSAQSAAKPDDLIFIGGSTFVVAEVL